MKSIKIPDSVTTIGRNAFFECSSLQSVVIPNVTEIGEYAFRGCSEMRRCEIGSGITTIRQSVFSNCSSLESVVIPNSVTKIGKYAFFNCSALRSVEIPNSITTIEPYTFYGCSSLWSVVIPNSVTTIGEKAFYDCSNLHSCEIGSSVTKIGVEAFANAFVKDEGYSIRCWAPTPPQLELEGKYYYPFDFLTFFYMTLYVPIGAKKNYEASDGWRQFRVIEEMAVSGVASVGNDAVSVVADGGRIVVSGADSNASMEVYSAAGQLVYRGAATTISVANRGIYIVRVAGKSYKIAL